MHLRIALVMAIALGCGDALPRTSLIGTPDPSAELRSACAFTEQKCTRCHTIGRVIAWEAQTREQWEPLVTRMRQMASSGITKADAEVVLDCLSQRNGADRTGRR